MANTEKIDHLLLDIRELEKLVASMRDAEIYPVSFFSRTFDLTHKMLKDLHVLEKEQIEYLRRQMEERHLRMQSIPVSEPIPQPEFVEPEQEPVQPQEVVLPVPEVEKPASPTVEKHPVFLSEVLEKRNLSDFRKAFSLNDRFYFRRELFAGDEAKMNKVISDLNELQSYEESVAYLNEKLNWNIEDETVADFIKLLEKRFL